jgi:hypothetical protein
MGIEMVISSTWPDIRQVKSNIRPDTGYKKWPDYLAGYSVHPFMIGQDLEPDPQHIPVYLFKIVVLFQLANFVRELHCLVPPKAPRKWCGTEYSDAFESRRSRSSDGGQNPSGGGGGKKAPESRRWRPGSEEKESRRVGREEGRKSGKLSAAATCSSSKMGR